jgi:hypothetical protein
MSGDQSVSLKNFQMEEHPSTRNAPSPAKSDAEFPECSPSGNMYRGHDGIEDEFDRQDVYSDNEDQPQTEHMEDHHKKQGDGKIIPPGMEYDTSPTSVSPRGIGGVTGVVKSAAALAAAHVVNEALVRPLSETTANVIGSVIGHLPLQTVTSPPHGATYHIPNSSNETIPAFGVTPGRTTHTNYVNHQNTILYFEEMQESRQQQACLQQLLDAERAEKDRLAKEYLAQGERLLKLDNYMTHILSDNSDFKSQCEALQASMFQQQAAHDATIASYVKVVEQLIE